MAPAGGRRLIETDLEVGMLKIAVMTKDHTLFASQLAEEEGWAHRQADFERLTDFEPQGCFVARKDDRPIGMVTTTAYEDYAFLGCLIVRREYRMEGVGKALLEHAVGYLTAKGVETIELDGLFPAVDLYRKLGFKDKHLCVVFRGKGKDAGASAAPYHPRLADGIVDFDKKMTGVNREKVIRRLLRDFQASVCMIEGEGISAYAVAKPRAGGLLAIGPFVAKNQEIAEELLHSIMSQYLGKPLALASPEINREAVDMLLRNGFVHAWPCLRMYLGERRDYHQHVYGIIALEKG